MAISKRVAERLSQQLKRFQPILAAARARDISESDTVLIITDMLCDMLGYRRYVDITTEFAIRGSYVDLAVKDGERVLFLVEAKAINSDLKENHVKQAVDYAANKGIEWVLLSNGAVWQFYRVHFRQPIDKAEIFSLDLTAISPKSKEALECLAHLAREEFSQQSMSALYEQSQATSRYTIAAALQSEPLLNALRRQLKQVAPRLRIEDDALAALLRDEVLKREVIEGDTAEAARAVFGRASRAAARAKARARQADVTAAAPPPAARPAAPVASEIAVAPKE